MAYESAEALPWCSPLFPFFFGEVETIFLFAVEQVVQLLCGAGVEDYGILFIIPTEAPCIEVGTANGAKLSVDGDDFGVMKPRFVEPDVATSFHEFVGIVETTVGSEGNIAAHTQHDVDFHASGSSALERLFQLVVEGEVGVDDFNTVAGVIDGREIELADNLIAGVGLTIDDAHLLVPFACAHVRFESLKRVGLQLSTAEIWCPTDVLPCGFVPNVEENLL